MNELIKVENRDGIATCNARELHGYMEVSTRFNDWIKNRVEKYDFVEDVDYTKATERIVTQGGTQDAISYYISLDMAKELSMVENNEKGKEARKYFIAIEKKAKELTKPINQFDMMRQQIQMLEDQEKRLSIVEAKLETSQREYFTIAGYASLIKRHIDVSHAAVLGRKATKMSRESDYDIGKITDQRYGECNTYHLDILKTVFMNN